MNVAERSGSSRPRAPYLNTAAYGLPPRPAWEAIQAAPTSGATGARGSTAGTRRSARRARAGRGCTASSVADVAVGPQVSPFAGLVAASLPAGRAGARARRRTSPRCCSRSWPRRRAACEVAAGAARAAGRRRSTAARRWSPSAPCSPRDGRLADLDAIAAAAAHHGARTLIDATQACGWLPLDAARFDYVVCARLQVAAGAARDGVLLRGRGGARRGCRRSPAGWYAADPPMENLYGGAAAAGGRRARVRRLAGVAVLGRAGAGAGADRGGRGRGDPRPRPRAGGAVPRRARAAGRRLGDRVARTCRIGRTAAAARARRRGGLRSSRDTGPTWTGARGVRSPCPPSVRTDRRPGRGPAPLMSLRPAGRRSNRPRTAAPTPWPGVGGAELVDAAVAGEQLAAVVEHDAQLGDRAVERVVLAAAGVGVRPRDGLARRGARLDDRRRGPRRGSPPAWPATRARPRRRRAGARRPSSVQRAVGDPRRRAPGRRGRGRPTRSSHASGASSNATPCSQIQVAACSAPQLWPTIPRQPVDVDAARVADLQPCRRSVALGQRALELRARQRRAVHPLAREVAQRLGVAAHRQLPGGASGPAPRRGRGRRPGRSALSPIAIQSGGARGPAASP